jgi:hypothetical protein
MSEQEKHPIDQMREGFQNTKHFIEDVPEEISEVAGQISLLIMDCFRVLDESARKEIGASNYCHVLEGSKLVHRLKGIASHVDVAVTTLSETEELAQLALEHLNMNAAEIADSGAATMRTMKAKNDSLLQELTAKRERLMEHAINSPAVRNKVWSITSGKCFYCSIELTRERDFAEPHRCFHVDHIVPKSVGGPDHLSNYVPACERCNVSKNAKPFAEFFRWRGEPGLKVVGGTDADVQMGSILGLSDGDKGWAQS